MSLLVVAGEASGDRAGAAVVAELRREHPSLEVFGMGGGALEREGVSLVADLRDATAMGIAEVARRAAGVALSYGKLRAAISKRKPKAALLVNYTEFNTRLARDLWPMGVRVLWYGAPQTWAWRKGRAAPLRRNLDRMAVMLPFEEALWRQVGVDAHYVGHPALEERRIGDEARRVARETLGMTPFASAVAILPGSRPHEARRLLQPMLEGYESVRREIASVDARVMLAPSLDARTRAWARAIALEAEVEVVDVDARAGMSYALPAFDAALCASGTASLECALARVVPIIAYKVGLVTEIGARALLSTPWIGLPNILLGRAAFPELLQRSAAASRIADELGRVLDEREPYVRACDEVERALGGHAHASHEVARMLEPWLSPRVEAKNTSP